MNGFIDLLLQNMSGGRKPDVTAGREGFGIRKPGRTDILPPPTRINPGLINLPNAKRPQQELPAIDIDQTDIETRPTERKGKYGTYVSDEEFDAAEEYIPPMDAPEDGNWTGRTNRGNVTDNILQRTLNEIAGLQNKEYTKGKGGFKDILKGLGLGALDAFSKADPRQGLAGMLGAATGGAAGLGIRSAIDSSADDRFIDERKMNKLYQDAAAQGQIADSEIRRQDVLNRGKDRETDNARLQAKLEQQALRDAVKSQLDQDKLDFSIDVAQKLDVWRNRKLDAEIAGNAVKAKQAQQRIDELIRNNQAKIDATNENVDRRINANPKNNPAPPRTKPANVPAKTALENGLTSRGIKPGSPEWNKVMQAAGY